MYGIYTLLVVLFVLAFLLIQYRPSAEGFANAAVSQQLMPACVGRSVDAQKLLARIGMDQTDDAAELRDLVSKLCCIEADLSTPGASTVNTLNFQFRTQQDIEPPSMIVGRCLRNALPSRDVEIIMEKFQNRGHILVDRLCADGRAEFDAVIARTRKALTVFCQGTQPQMDCPAGVRDVGFWESAETADLREYNRFPVANPDVIAV
jgi:hypothetical protein